MVRAREGTAAVPASLALRRMDVGGIRAAIACQAADMAGLARAELVGSCKGGQGQLCGCGEGGGQLCGCGEGGRQLRSVAATEERCSAGGIGRNCDSDLAFGAGAKVTALSGGHLIPGTR